MVINMSELKKILNKYDFNFKKKFGQNFIKDENILNRIVEESGIDKDTVVVEIGVGAAVLTRKLCENASSVIGYEIDNTLKDVIKTSLDNYNNIELIFDDFMNRNLVDDLKKYRNNKIYVVANIPYYITTPIITKILESELDVKKIVIMIQKEVADRLNAKPGNKEYNSLTIFINYYYDVRKLFDVGKKSFIPVPNVDSSVISLSKNKKYLVHNEKIFFKLIRDAFRYKRKTIKNNLSDYDINLIENILKKHNFDLTVRAEQLDIKIFVEIANALA